jgi:TRAP transporter TAXI family solute receptor
MRLRTATAALLLLSAAAGASVWAQDIRYFRIGSGASSDSFFMVGGILANAISNPPGSRDCEDGGSCGVPGLIAVAQSTRGSVENIEAVADGRLESAISQADVVYWAYHGTGLYRDHGAYQQLRVIANLFPAFAHILVRRDSDIHEIGDLRGRKVSLGEPGSGSLVDARYILAAYGLEEADTEPLYEKPGRSADLLRDGAIDAMIVVGGLPVAAIDDLSRSVGIRLLPISGTPGEELKSFYPFFADAVLPAEAYAGIAETPTVSVSTQWIVSAEADEDLIYEITRALWHERTRTLLDQAAPETRSIRLETALARVAIPLHPGAARFYAEAGVKR